MATHLRMPDRQAQARARRAVGADEHRCGAGAAAGRKAVNVLLIMSGRHFRASRPQDGTGTMLEIRDAIDWSRVRKSVFVLLGMWIVFFLVVHAFVHALNKLTLPIVGVRLGSYLAIQGSLILVLVLLYLLAKKQQA
jgi:putative solute:sodium symporter small subunit